MKIVFITGLVAYNLLFSVVSAADFDHQQFAKDYFTAWTATQSPTANPADIEKYLALLTDDVGHQHYPYDPDDSRSPEGKANMREGMTHYLAAHTEYKGVLKTVIEDFNVVVIQYDTSFKAIHPQSKEVITDHYSTLEVLELENGLVSMIRKYSQ